MNKLLNAIELKILCCEIVSWVVVPLLVYLFSSDFYRFETILWIFGIELSIVLLLTCLINWKNAIFVFCMSFLYTLAMVMTTALSHARDSNPLAETIIFFFLFYIVVIKTQGIDKKIDLIRKADISIFPYASTIL